MSPRISIVIVTYNDISNLIDCISSVKKQIYPSGHIEIIIIDDGSTDGTSETVRTSFPEVKIIKKENSGPDNSRMHGVNIAKGEIIAFLDSDCIAPPDWIGNIVSSLETNKSFIIGGQILHRGNLFTRLIGISDFGELQGKELKEVSNIPTCNMGIKKDIFNDFTFHQCLGFGGDAVFCNQLRQNGHKLLYDPKVKIIHRPKADFFSFFKRGFQYGEVFIYIRRIDPGLHHTGLLKYGIPGIVVLTLGRTILDWHRLFRYKNDMEIAFYEIIPSMFFLFLKRLFSLFGAIKGYMMKCNLNTINTCS